MNEILKGKIYDSAFDEELDEVVKTRIYHIYYKNGNVYVDAPFPVKYMKKLRLYLAYGKIIYKNIIIGKPDL